MVSLDQIRPPILVVNDNIQEAEQLCQFFDALGADATMALGVVSAAELLRTVRPAIVLIVELRLDGDSCKSASAWLRRRDGESHRPYYVCAGHGVEQPHRSSDEDFDLYLDLPVSSALAHELIQVARAKHQQLQQARAHSPQLDAPPVKAQDWSEGDRL